MKVIWFFEDEVQEVEWGNNIVNGVFNVRSNGKSKIIFSRD